MANTIRLRRRAAGGSAGAPATLVASEPAFNEVDDVLYYGKGNSGGNAQSIIPIGGPGAFLSLTLNQTITGTKTFNGTFDAAGGTVNVATQATTDDSTKAASTAFVHDVAQPLDADLTAIAAISVNGSLHRTAAGTWVSRTLTGTSGRIAVTNGDGVSGNPTVDLATVTVAGSGVGTYTKLTVDGYGRVTGTAQASITDLGVPTADVAYGGFKITGLADPVNPQDAATKNYVDLARQGIDAKASCRVSTSTNINLASPGATLDGVTMAANDRVLVYGQTVGAQNGIYVWNGASSAMTRATDADTAAKINPGMFTFVEEGSNADKGFVLTTDGPVTLGTTTLSFTIFNTAGTTYSFNNGLVNSSGTVGLTGQALALHQLAVDGLITRTASGTVAARAITGTANQIDVSNGSGVAGNPTLSISATYVGQTSITTLGTVGTGTWQATAIGLGYGGTGAANAADARTNLGIGSMGTQSAASVSITGGSIAGVTLDNVVIDGGTF